MVVVAAEVAVAASEAAALAKATRWAADEVTASAKDMASPLVQAVETMVAEQGETAMAAMADMEALAAVMDTLVAIELLHQLRYQKRSACNQQIRAINGDLTRVRTPAHLQPVTLYYPQIQHQW